MSDTTLVVSMLGLIVVVGIGIFGSVWLAGRTATPALEQALERQPAELVVAPDEVVTNVVFEEAGPDECRPGPIEVLAIEVADGAVRWQQELAPFASSHHAALAVIADGDGGHVAVAVDERIGEGPPSVAALDVATGQPRWQRFVAADSIHPILVGPDSLVLSSEWTGETVDHGSPGEPIVEYFTIDGTGDVANHPTSASNDGTGPVPEVRSEFAHLSDLYPMSPLLGDWPGADRMIRAIPRDDFGVRSVEAPDPITGETVFIDDLPFDADFDLIGSQSSPGDPIQIGEDLALVVIGSSFGPNTRLAVYDRADGTLQWTIDHTRAGAVAGRNILYDKRNDEPPEAESTRDIHLVAGDDPERELWSTALVVNGEGGNGFLGTVDGAPVFAVESAAAAGGLEFVSIDGRLGADVPDLIEAAERYGSGVTERHHVDADVLAAATTDGVVVQPTGGEAVLVETAQEPTQVTRVDDVLLVVANHSTVFCD